ncbi:TVP38/TMEM64 family protein [Streptococcus parauberis]|uniref:TVP38/TMEM64 family membrane protein n=1 Tax=Streptococcus parauberis KRS-02083 TaxID=1207545 RepID=A0ABP2SZ87_9STRE|nr:VTT domain-containing protein [Streptococcus parauberis]AUT06205.1 putative membrane protein YhjE [Streptococcus parauberis]EMG25789.1 Immunoreactive protein [Streptococcus parauberis KRS-02083]PIO78216.1 SNARE associated Golgi protein [Streptococcus parauberis]POS67786.1 SNARE associated Golgi protein [Streptococcus parauberis]UWV09598.1 VTT domain-containing protein [Streptococcus parauberis]
MKDQNSKTYKFMQKLFKILGLLALVGTFFLVLWAYRLGILNDSNALKDLVMAYPFWGPVIFIVVQIFQIVFPVIPGGLTTIAGFLIFGPIEGFIYNYIGIIIGSYLLFIIVKIYGRKFILLFVDEKTFYSYERKLETPGYEKIFILCMASPISPADIMVMITGLTNMSSKRFLSIIMIFKPISIIGYSYLFIFGEDLIRWFIK